MQIHWGPKGQVKTPNPRYDEKSPKAFKEISKGGQTPESITERLPKEASN